MNGRAYVIASGLLVTATGAALVGSATAAATSGPSRTTTVRRYHETRPGRATSKAIVLPSVDPAVRARSEAVAITRWVEAVNTNRWFDAVAENLTREAAATAAARPRSSGYRGNILECIKHRESDGQYDVVNSSSGAAGAYQFMPGTWNTTARAAGRPDLVGVNPSAASPADQDAMAQFLMATQGLGPWGGGCG